MVAAGRAIAWSGATSELGLILEPLAAVQQSNSSAISEHEMLRERFQLDAGLDLMRLHMIGPADALAEVGHVQMNGVTYSEFPAADSSMSAAKRLLWDGVLRGVPVAADPANGALHRRSVILVGDTALVPDRQIEQATWSRDEERAVLSRKTWSAAARRAHFDAATAAPEPVEPPIDEGIHADAGGGHEQNPSEVIDE